MKKPSLYVMWATFASAVFCVLTLSVRAAEPVPGSGLMPMQYIGPKLPDNKAPDGHLMYSPGVQNIQISRGNRKASAFFDNQPGWTYQHHIGITCWKGRLYAIWDMTPVDEDGLSNIFSVNSFFA